MGRAHTRRARAELTSFVRPGGCLGLRVEVAADVLSLVASGSSWSSWSHRGSALCVGVSRACCVPPRAKGALQIPDKSNGASEGAVA